MIASFLRGTSPRRPSGEAQDGVLLSSASPRRRGHLCTATRLQELPSSPSTSPPVSVPTSAHAVRFVFSLDSFLFPDICQRFASSRIGS
nr:uncharacterized protein LOC127334671 isoform X2 [Lolium perenne]XP_051217154.1 uncharacterized protein LOC127334671 isoform X3 [Lolium perenne]